MHKILCLPPAVTVLLLLVVLLLVLLLAVLLLAADGTSCFTGMPPGATCMHDKHNMYTCCNKAPNMSKSYVCCTHVA